MSTTNPVSQVLITGGNQAPLAAGNVLSALAPLQVGVFNYHTGLSVGAASALADCQDVYLAVGINRTGAGGGATLEDINQSSGQMIQSPLVRGYMNRCYTAPLPQIWDIAGFTAKCETEYGIKLELRNGEIYTINGYNQFVKTFFVKTGCCTDQCVPCADGNCNEISNGLVTDINADPDQLLTASYFVNKITATVAAEPTAAGNIVVTVGTTDYTVAIVDADTVTTAAAKIVAVINTQADSPYYATNLLGVMSIYPKTSVSGETTTLVYTTPVAGMTITPIVAATRTAVSVAGYAAFVAANPGVCLGITISTNPTASYPFNGDIPLKYWYVRGTVAIVSLIEGFTCNGTATMTQQLVYTEGSGYDLRWQEYLAGGWNGKPGPYRVSALLGVQRSGFEYFATATANYHQVTLTYDMQSQSNFEHYQANLQTIIGIPCADTTTLTGLIAILDHIFPQFPANAGNAALCDCTGDETTDEYAAANNGIKMVAR
jgi:hypothetical protein